MTIHYIALYTDVKSTEDVTPLHFACVGGNKEIVQYLLQKLKLDVGKFVCAYIIVALNCDQV